MTHLLKISEAASLAFHTMVLLAAKPKDMLSTRVIADTFKVSENHLSKVLQRLTKAGLVESIRGPKGGFQLSKPGDEISLIEVYEAIEGPMVMDTCLLSVSKCSGARCIMGDLLRSVHEQVRDYFTNTRISDLVDVIESRFPEAV